MADVRIPDDILHNVLARLPAKPLLRSRCVSKHWNRLISDPYFMKSRSCRRMLLSTPPCYQLDGSLPADILGYLSELQSLVDIRIAGTINGVVLLLVPDHINVGRSRQMIIYNPLTRASKIVHDPYSSSSTHNIYGFCCGDDLKIVRFRDYNNQNWNTCDVFNLKTSIWSTSKIPILNARFMNSDGDYAGMFLNGYLYWIASNKIVALRVEEMVISYVPLPVLDYALPDYSDFVWGTLHGCFCMITEAENIYDFNVWIMKEHGVGVENPWSKIHSFRLPLELRSIPGWQVFNYAMDDGRIFMVDHSNNLVIYDILNHSYKVLATPLSYVNNCYSHAIEYDESLISLSDICGF